ncbi:MAG: prepilin-type N-terminal cleavage/methylation domain-containing protein [Armatimonadota bacterium]|nr:type II secretion system protein GspG [bacterium]
MHHLMDRVRSKRGFTLVELLVVVVVLAVLAAIVLPKFMDSGKRSKESAQASDLKIIRNAVQLFYTDTGYYPATLDDLTQEAAASVKVYDSGSAVTLPTASDYHGPYLQEVPDDPVSGSAFAYTNSTGKVEAP